MFHHKRGLKFQNIIFPRTLYWQGHPASHLPWLRPDARGRLWQPSEDDQLLADDESNEAGGAVAVTLGTGDHLNVPGSGNTTGTSVSNEMKILFSQAGETLKAGGFIQRFLPLVPIAPSDTRIQLVGALITEIISGENDYKPRENTTETLAEPEMSYFSYNKV